ncbi:MAG: exo-alpha-sialidase, partial [Myxococcales bacterium]
MLALALLLAAGSVAPIVGGNALTLPSARHVVRVGPAGTLLVALQQDGAQGHMLGWFRSDDAGTTWRHYAPIQDTRTDRDTVDVLVSGNDIAMVYSYEGPSLSGSAAHDVFFQWWRFDGAADWKPGPAVRVFDSASASSAFYRGLLARDSAGRIWIQAFELKPDGSSRAAISVSTNGGASFTRLPDLAVTAARGGGRLVHLGKRLMFLWGTHRYPDVGSMRFHDDAADPASWSTAVTALPEGIYHGAALSSVADGRGGLHLVYKDGSIRLFYRHFDGATWGPRTLLEGAVDWATQPAVTLIGDSLLIFYNHPVTMNLDYRFVYRV